jgi:hypothetical protein
MLALPSAFALAGRHRVGTRSSQAHGLDGVGCSTQFVVRHVRGRDGMARCTGNLTRRRVSRAARRGVSREGCLPRFADGGFTARPRTSRLDRAAGPVILGTLGGEQRQDMLGAVGSPACEQAVVGRVQEAAPMGGHETWIPRPCVLGHILRNSAVSAWLLR